MEWTYFDLDSDFEMFKAAWDSRIVQRQLEQDMRQWCRDCGLPMWTRGEPLWNLCGGAGDWDCIIGQRARCKLDEILRVEDNATRNFEDSMRRACGKSFRDAETAFVDLIYSRLLKESYPRPDSYHSLVLFHGGDYLAESLLKTALVMYPDDFAEIRDGGSHNAVVIPSRGLVLDILGFFSWKELKDDACAPYNLYFPETDEEYEEFDEVGYTTQEEESCSCWECSNCDDLGQAGLF